jgi:hypothetical protein
MTLKSALLAEEIQAVIEPIRSDKKLYQLVRDCLPLAEPGTDQRQVIKPLFLLPMLV